MILRFFKKKVSTPPHLALAQQLLQQTVKRKTITFQLYHDDNTTIDLTIEKTPTWIIQVNDAHGELWVIDPLWRVLEDKAYMKLMGDLAKKASEPTNNQYKTIQTSNPNNGITITIQEKNEKAQMKIMIPFSSDALLHQFTAVENIYNILLNSAYKETNFREWCIEKIGSLLEKKP